MSSMSVVPAWHDLSRPPSQVLPELFSHAPCPGKTPFIGNPVISEQPISQAYCAVSLQYLLTRHPPAGQVHPEQPGRTRFESVIWCVDSLPCWRRLRIGGNRRLFNRLEGIEPQAGQQFDLLDDMPKS